MSFRLYQSRIRIYSDFLEIEWNFWKSLCYCSNMFILSLARTFSILSFLYLELSPSWTFSISNFLHLELSLSRAFSISNFLHLELSPSWTFSISSFLYLELPPSWTFSISSLLYLINNNFLIMYCELDHCDTLSNVMALILWSFKIILFVF